MTDIDVKIKKKLQQRDHLRKLGKFQEADTIRNQLLTLGYAITDTKNGSRIDEKKKHQKSLHNTIGKIILFGSGELSSTGRKIHEYAIQDREPPLSISLLETPAGYEDNPHQWYKKLQAMLEVGLKNYSPIVTRIPALRKDGDQSTNDPKTVAPLLTADYIHTGAGSPTYAVAHLRDSLAMSYIQKRVHQGVPLSLASAATIAFGTYSLPVYELYFAGHDPYWVKGLGFFEQWNIYAAFVPHWNNTEGGSEIDTRFAYMGKRRFDVLLSLLPKPTMIIGIDEHTALIFDFSMQSVKVLGKGCVTISTPLLRQIFQSGEEFPLWKLQHIKT